jgi:hypothetical protein
MLTQDLQPEVLPSLLIPQLFSAALVLAMPPVVLLVLFEHLLRRVRKRPRRSSPEDIIAGNTPEEPVGPDVLCHRILERAERIQKALVKESPSEVEVEMCALGYMACEQDLGLLIDLVGAELPLSGPFRRLKLRTERVLATEAVLRMREVFPPAVLHGIEQESS